MVYPSAATCKCPTTPSTVPPTPPRLPPRPALPPSLNPLLPRRPPNNPGPLSERSRILFITQELKRNITYDPFNYTGSWVGNNYCLFKGYYCDTVPDKNITGLAGIDFNGARFGGNLNFYRYIMNLPDIAIFHVNSNNFSGIIRPNIYKLRYFYEIDLSNNKFAGGFPRNLLNASQLTFVDFRFNTYNGPIPRQVFNLQTDVLFINNNGFTRSIPSNFGNTPALYITLANNKFIGGIPTTIGQARNTLIEVLFLGNNLTGCLPYEIGFLNGATVFDVGSNRLTGTIPLSFACLESMSLLNLANNRFYGSIPESLCTLRNAYNFTLSHNYFTQVGPICRTLIRLGRLNVDNNCILGLLRQRPASECATFFRRQPSCPRPDTFGIIPCPFTTPSLKKTVFASDKEISPAPSPTYAALVKPPH
ncbi:hypothetical protein L1049_026699 [Liquidambar formosana]|uniref:Uncharacterized protein n=1 Tax=Liquidambar formosana TaxID=63359 RepID=A0AAP0R6M7_LIQFO